MEYTNVNVFYIRKTNKAYLLRMCYDNQEVWYPKSLVRLVNEKRGYIQNVPIANFILGQKGYPDVRVLSGEKDLITDDQGYCVVCGAKTVKPEFKYCKKCYGRNKQQGRERLIEYECLDCGTRQYYKKGDYNFFCEHCGREQLESDVDKSGIRDIFNVFDKMYKHKLYCPKCGTIFYLPDHLYKEGVQCDYCGIPLTDMGTKLVKKGETF